MANSTEESVNPDCRIIQWLLDTRPLWPVAKNKTPKEQVVQLKTVASKALSFLTPAEQAGVLKYYHVRDAKMALGSHLLKHLIVTKYRRVPWSESKLSRDTNGKPCFLPDADSEENHVEFNVSHQAGLVTLIAVVGRRGINVGTDIVCVNERIDHDNKYIEEKGFFDWVDIYTDMFAPSEISFMKIGELDVGVELQGGYAKDIVSRCQRRNEVFEVETTEGKIKLESNKVVEAKLRRFYTMWCLREAYVKMTGEALLASWLRQLEILGFKVPAAKEDISDEYSLEEGDIVKEFRIRFQQRSVTNVKMQLIALGEHYIVGGAMRSSVGVDFSGLEMVSWTELDLERDVLAFGEEIS